MARKQLETWGGEVHLPRWLRRRHKAEPGDTSESSTRASARVEPGARCSRMPTAQWGRWD